MSAHQAVGGKLVRLVSISMMLLIQSRQLVCPLLGRWLFFTNNQSKFHIHPTGWLPLTTHHQHQHRSHHADVLMIQPTALFRHNYFKAVTGAHTWYTWMGRILVTAPNSTNRLTNQEPRLKQSPLTSLVGHIIAVERGGGLLFFPSR